MKKDDHLFDYSPFELGKKKKEYFLSKELIELSQKHYVSCTEYKNMLDAVGCSLDKLKSYYDIPFLPVGIFKNVRLSSISDQEIFKVMTSSGTTGQTVSKIILDRQTASNQQKVLAKIVSSFTGAARMPMLILDSPSVIKDRAMFSARGAGILGFSIFGTERCYALTEDMELDIKRVEDFLARNGSKPFLMFGFTFIVWLHFYNEIKKLSRKIDFSNGILIHGGGWKKLESEAVSAGEFNSRLYDVCFLSKVHNYYGMVEQTGAIYMECECGHFHASIFSDIITRRYKDFSVCDVGEKGIIEVVTPLASSYPGHVLLTEDEGTILGEDDCACGRKGKYFSVHGRLKNAEIRGCSDTYAA